SNLLYHKGKSSLFQTNVHAQVRQFVYLCSNQSIIEPFATRVQRGLSSYDLCNLELLFEFVAHLNLHTCAYQMQQASALDDLPQQVQPLHLTLLLQLPRGQDAHNIQDKKK